MDTSYGKSNEADYKGYKQNGNVVKEMTRKIKDLSWDRLISNIHHDIAAKI